MDEQEEVTTGAEGADVEEENTAEKVEDGIEAEPAKEVEELTAE